MQQSTSTSPRHNAISGESYSDKGAVGIGAIWLTFYVVIGIATVVHNFAAGVAAVASID